LIEIGSKTAEKNSAQTNKPTDRQTDTTKIMVTWPWTNYALFSGGDWKLGHRFRQELIRRWDSERELFLRPHPAILQNIIRCWIFNTTQAVAPRVGVASWYYCAASATPLSAVTR